jgi:hypothetical protein
MPLPPDKSPARAGHMGPVDAELGLAHRTAPDRESQTSTVGVGERGHRLDKGVSRRETREGWRRGKEKNRSHEAVFKSRTFPNGSAVAGIQIVKIAIHQV